MFLIEAIIVPIFTLLVLFQIKHFVADYPLQGKYMLQKFREDWGFFLPLLAHSGVHAVLTFLIAILYVGNSTAIKLAIFDLVVHFIMDRIKASPKMLGRFKSLSPDEYVACASMAAYDGKDENFIVGKKMGERKIRNNKLFWWALGLDQMVHHLTHYFIIFVIIGKILGY